MSNPVRLYFLTSRVVGLSDVYLLAEPHDEPGSNYNVDTRGKEYVFPEGCRIRSARMAPQS